MPPSPNILTPPPFTECIKDGNSAPPDSQQMARRLQELIEQIQNQPNPSARALLQDCLQSLLTFYGEGLGRILQCVQGAGSDGQKIMEQLLKEKAISALLLIHGLHPLDLETRLRSALDSVRPYMRSHGGNVELLTLENDFARLRLEGTCKSCPSSTVTLEFAVRRAIEEACPDLLGFEVEGSTAAEVVH
jgi:Fe-S cluster biogenesis protein NfuA